MSGIQLGNMNGNSLSNQTLTECILETLNILDEELAELKVLEDKKSESLLALLDQKAESVSSSRLALENITNFNSKTPNKTPKTPSQKLVQSIQRLRAASIQAKASKESKSLVSYFDREIDQPINRGDGKLKQLEQQQSHVERDLIDQLSVLETKYLESERRRSDAEMMRGIEEHNRLSMSMKLEKAMKRVNEQETVISSLQQRVKDYSIQVEYLSDALQWAQAEARESLESMNLKICLREDPHCREE